MVFIEKIKMKNWMLLILGFMVLSLSCKKTSIAPSDCLSIADATILSEEEKESECIYRNVFTNTKESCIQR